MIIRVVSIVSLILLLILVLYLPSAHPPERFITQLGVEHERNNAFWGEERALHILSRMLALHTDAKVATYRFSTFVEWLPYLSVFVVAALLDGFIRRIVKSKEFLQHNPELFALHASLVILIACGTVVSFVLPVTVHPLLLALAPACIGIFGSLTVANYHHRG